MEKAQKLAESKVKKNIKELELKNDSLKIQND